jgi:hypothetical protein
MLQCDVAWRIAVLPAVTQTATRSRSRSSRLPPRRLVLNRRSASDLSVHGSTLLPTDPPDCIALNTIERAAALSCNHGSFCMPRFHQGRRPQNSQRTERRPAHDSGRAPCARREAERSRNCRQASACPAGVPISTRCSRRQRSGPVRARGRRSAQSTPSKPIQNVDGDALACSLRLYEYSTRGAGRVSRYHGALVAKLGIPQYQSKRRQMRKGMESPSSPPPTTFTSCQT